ncbi:MAG: nitroreductase family protein, partial [Candidatus Hodarchaeales archaeon]
RYGDRGYQYVHLEVGHALQNFLLQLTSLNLYTNVVTEFNATQVRELLNTSLTPLVILPVGKTSSSLYIKDHIKMNSLIKTNEMTVEQAIAKRKSIREYSEGEIPLTVIQDIFNTSIDIDYFEESEDQINLIAVIGKVSGLTSGLYQYAMDNKSLIQYNTTDYRQALQNVALKQPWVGNAQLDLVISVNISWIYQQSDYYLVHKKLMFNIGMIAQNVYLKCTSYGLGNVVVGAFEDAKLTSLLGLPSSYSPVYIIPIGLTPSFS